MGKAEWELGVSEQFRRNVSDIQAFIDELGSTVGGSVVEFGDTGQHISLKFDNDLTDDQVALMTSVLRKYELPPEDYTKDDYGRMISVPSFEDVLGRDTRWKGYLFTTQPGVQNIFDVKLVDEEFFRGGWYEILGGTPQLGDYIEFAVVDKDDVLGLFSQYGLVVGTHVLELQKYVQQEFVNPVSTRREVFQANSVYQSFLGLYGRIIYVSTGSEAVTFKTNFLVYE